MKSDNRPNGFSTSRTSPASSNDEYMDGGMPNGMEHFSPFPNQPVPAFPDAMSMPDSRPGSIAAQGNVHSFQKQLPSSLHIHPTPQKSRVETQIAIKISLYPVPEGITKLHLPSHTISKPKLLAKPPPTRSVDTLELYTMLVCTSAMQDPIKLQRALTRAATQNLPDVKKEKRRSSAGDAKSDDESLPLNGGEVNICDGCITRERKRAARKKSKKPEEEEPWQKDEAKRIVVFNTTEIKEWQDLSPPEKQVEGPNGRRDSRTVEVPKGSKQIDLPMRIACYCRHQNEKHGFQVIFTIKDQNDKLIAQSMTSPIVITDDHKTHAPPAVPTLGPFVADQTQMPGGSMYGREPLENYGGGLYRNAHSTTDLQSLQHFNAHFGMQAPMSAFAIPQPPSHNTSTSLTPRNMSRQASPSATGNTVHKKRKASGGSIKLPGNLQMTQMTRLDTGAASGPQNQQWNGGNTNGFTMSPNGPAQLQSAFPSMNGPRHASQRSAQFYSGPPTPSHEGSFFNHPNRSQSFENLASMQQIFPISQSAHPSRVPSPISGAQAMSAIPTPMQPGPMPATFSPTAGATPTNQRQPTIHKLIPSEGPKAGGIEVTCLGSGFRQGLEVMFGDSLATTTTYWGETSLVCLLPPAIQAGTVTVTFKHQYQQQRAQMPRFASPPMPKSQAIFKYVDDDEQELFRQAVFAVHQKMYGTLLDGGDMARNIINLRGAGGAQGGWASGLMGGEHHRQAALSHGVDSESLVLKCLDLIDQDESPFPARLNSKRRNGQGLLHLAASLGYTRLVAGLVARGANPDLRDRNGMSPMHMAALNGHAQIVRKLRLAGGDPTLRSLRGFTPADMVTTQALLDAVEAVPEIFPYTRSRSAGANTVTYPSQPNSSTSLVSLEQSPSFAQYDFSDSSADSEDDLPEMAPSRSRGQRTPAQQWARSRRNSAAVEPQLAPPQLEVNNGFLTPTAAMAAWRDQLAAQIQHFQQNVNWTFPNLQIPALPTIPNPSDYQDHPMVRRISSLVPQRTSRSDSEPGNDSKEGWWDRLTGSSPPPPPYEEIFPGDKAQDLDKKASSAICAASDAAADQKCSAIYDGTKKESSSKLSKPIQIGKGLSAEEFEELKLVHKKKLTKLKHDRYLWSVWVCVQISDCVMTTNTNRYRSCFLWLSLS